MEIGKKLFYINYSENETTILFESQQDNPIEIDFQIYSKILIISEEVIFKKYQKYINLFEKTINNVHFFFSNESDFHKNSFTKDKIDNLLLEKNFDSNSLIIGFGGGKITDLSGYVASTFLRGVDLLLIPTTLLSMVDASLGGKTGINNLHYGKNLIGSFYNPK